MDGFSEEQPGSRRKAIIIAASIMGVVLLGSGVAFLLWRRAQGPAVVVPPGQNVNANQPVNQPATNQPGASLTPEQLAELYPMKPQAAGTVSPTNPEPVDAGLNRPMTAEEKERYGFNERENVRIITSSPTDGSVPEATFDIVIAPRTTQADKDGDGLSDAEEKALGTDPENVDTDGDGVQDWEEVKGDDNGDKTDPLKPDTDGDGKTDGLEHGGFPNDPTQ